MPLNRELKRSLRPAVDSYDPNGLEEERRRNRLARYLDAARALYLASETKRPFYPESIYDLLGRLDETAWTQGIQYR